MHSYIFRTISTVFTIIYTLITLMLSNTQYTKDIPNKSDLLSQDPTYVASPAVTIVNIVQNDENIGFSLQQAISLYSENIGENIKFSVQTIANTSDYNFTLKSKLLSGEQIDLFTISGARQLNELNEYIVDLSDLAWLQTASFDSLAPVSRENRIYGIPYSIEASGLIANADIFQSADIDITKIRSFENLSDIFKALNDKIITGELREEFPELESVCEFPGQDAEFLGSTFADIATSMSFSDAIEAAEATDIVLGQNKSIEDFLILMARYSAKGHGWEKLAEISNAQQIERFANARVAVILQDTNIDRAIDSLNPERKWQKALLPIPLESLEIPSIYAGVSSYWAINSSSNEQSANASKSFLEWLYCSGQGAELFATEFEAVSVFRDTAFNTGLSLNVQMLQYLGADMAMPQIHNEFPNGWGKNIFAVQIQQYLTEREKTWDDVISMSQEGWG